MSNEVTMSTLGIETRFVSFGKLLGSSLVLLMS